MHDGNLTQNTNSRLPPIPSRQPALTALAIVTGGTALSETLFFIFAPQPNIPLWAQTLGLTTLYNAALSLPLYWAVRRLVGAHRKERNF